MITDIPRCFVCGEPMPTGEEMFVFHGFSGPCPKPPLPQVPQPLEQERDRYRAALERIIAWKSYSGSSSPDSDALVLSEYEQGANDAFETLQSIAGEAFRAPLPADPGRLVPHHGSGPDNQ